jgi:hypothetical protein
MLKKKIFNKKMSKNPKIRKYKAVLERKIKLIPKFKL